MTNIIETTEGIVLGIKLDKPKPCERITEDALKRANVICMRVAFVGAPKVKSDDAEVVYAREAKIIGNTITAKCLMMKMEGNGHLMEHYLVPVDYKDMTDEDTFLAYHIANGDVEEAEFWRNNRPASAEELEAYNKIAKSVGWAKEAVR